VKSLQTEFVAKQAELEVRVKSLQTELVAKQAELEVRVKSLQTELVAKQVEKGLLIRTTQSREQELSRGRTRVRELRGADAAKPGRN
jgi:circadian clock protein KaiC